jgi:hypothetical protein
MEYSLKDEINSLKEIKKILDSFYKASVILT